MTQRAASILLTVLFLIALPAARADDHTSVEIPDTPAGGLLEWWLGFMEAPTEESAAERLADTLNDSPAPAAERLASDMRRVSSNTGGGFVPIKVLEIDPLELDVLLRAKDNKSWWIASIGTNPTPPHQLTTYRMKPLIEPPQAGGQDWGDLNWALSNFRLPPGVSIRVERTENGQTKKPYLRLHEDDRVAIGPAAKLFPFALIAERAVEDLRFFDRLVPLKGDVESLISPNFPRVTDGETYAASELLSFALRDDLTALDQLIAWLGRTAVEAFVAKIQGPDSPNFPFLTTGEFYKLKLLEGDLYESYVNAETEDERRILLGELALRRLPSEEDAAAIVTPTRVREIEWRASADELCAALARIEKAMDADETGRVREAFNEISERNRQMGIWTFVFQVSGGEPGVFAEAFLLERLDGARFRFALAFEDPDEEIDYERFARLSSSIITLLALEP